MFLHDFGEIASLLNRDGIPPDELWPRIDDEGKARARIILAEHQKQALKLVGHLFEYGRVSRAKFSSLMMGEQVQVARHVPSDVQYACSIA